MISKDDGELAFPVSNGMGDCTYGMTLRDYFAAQAMQGVSANPNGLEVPENIANYAYKVADAMLKARGE